MTYTVSTSRSLPRSADAVGIAVATSGAVPRGVGLSRAALANHGFDGKVGQTLVVPSANGATVVAVGVGDARKATAADVRNAAAAFARATAKHEKVALSIVDAVSLDARSAGQAAVEGFLLASYRFHQLKTQKSVPSGTVTIVSSASKARGADAGVERGKVTAGAVYLARDLANLPPAHLTARLLADRAVQVAQASGLDVEVFDKDKIEVLGLGGLLAVNKGSVEPPRMVKLTYTPQRGSRGAAAGHLVMVGKGVTYDSGGISLKPSDPMHANMKMDMTGAASVLSAMSALAALGCPTKVTGYLMCTDNRPSGSAMAMGDVLTFRNGKTAEIHNTDAEGRLILADGLSLAVEAKPHAIVDIATLTGACMAALGPKMAGVLGSNQSFIDQVIGAADTTDERVWQLPLERSYRKFLDSNVADMKNIGGPYGGAITAALFLNEFTGDVPWAHLDIAGPMNVDGDDGWLSRGATGYGTRLLIELAMKFKRPTGRG
ncbi:MAG: leucyl aminopeptidase [Actinomycetota bacterium]|nr:leucyl aminopeptidase [Actinomycetota bacterium]MDA2972268.1 leucyl aminopeptidase [Actinomycetota bacterium]MDA3002244.1 leucyl aminopeptidase [Actinomycetota bacterium]